MAGFDNDVLVAVNANYDPTNILTAGQPPYLGQITANGQLFIGAAAAPFLRPGFITGSGGVTVTNGPGTINIAGTGASTDLHVAKYIVNSSLVGTGANYTTISAAIAAAVGAGVNSTIFVQPGTYTENIVLAAGVNISAFVCDSSVTRTNTSTMTGNVVIRGKLSASYSGRACISNLWIEAISDYALEMTGANPTYLVVKDCSLIGVSNSIIHSTNNGGGWFGLNNCYADLQTTGITYFVLNPGNLDAYYCHFFNSGGSSTASTSASGGTTFTQYSTYATPITTSGSWQALCDKYSGTLTLNGTPNIIENAFFSTGSNSCVSVGTGVTATLVNGDYNSSNTNVITGLGTASISGISYSGSSKLVNTTTQTLYPTNKGAYKVALPAGDYTVLATDEIVGATSSAARAITLNASPSTGQVVTIKDVTGTAAANNITITPAAGNIDGAGTKVINTNYGSVDLWYSGTQWFVK